MEENNSRLGFGCMRFPRKASGGIDMKLAEQMVLHAIENGITYFDTAYIYPGIEEALGKILKKNNCREKVRVATKLQHYQVKKTEDFEICFQEQLRRLQTDYVDYYLMHMLPDVFVWEKLVRLGVVSWLHEKKQEGKIRHVGFSYHGGTETFKELIDVYDWEMCLVQYNYMDENSQAGKTGIKYAYEKNIPVYIMEPLRGGRLANELPKKAMEFFQETNPHRSPAEWAFRWLWDQKEVSLVLSGMNSMEMLDENIRVAKEVQIGEFGEKEKLLIEKVKASINAKMKVPCTGCGYCMPCPMGVDIPGVFRCYNVRYTDGFYTGMKEYFMCTTLKQKKSNASLCVGCRKCEEHCPQQISIHEKMKDVSKHMENIVYKVGKIVAKKITDK